MTDNIRKRRRERIGVGDASAVLRLEVTLLAHVA